MNFNKLILVAAVLCLITSTSFSQIGIGTTNPDASSMLDITSTTSGMLTPRMTTTQRVAIATPADGLLVYDTDKEAFYYWDNSVWNRLGSGEKRNNYKLVKSITDLADELTAGGGSTYLLDENYLYEINGTITFDYPVDLNGANIAGRDTGEDIIVNGSGTTLFSGTKGGRFRDILIDGGGQQVFDITSDGTQSVVGYSVLVTNASSLGNLSNLYAVFFNVLQVVNTNNGFNVSNITSFFVDKVFWTDGNAGTFLNLSGTFDNLQIANGRVVVNAGETGIDVSSNPTITVSASLTSVNFTGAGTIVNGYTAGTYLGYNFTNDWDVDCPGIPLEKDTSSIGDINMNFNSGTGATTTFTGNSVPSKISGTTLSNNLFRFAKSGDNRLIYEGKKTRYFTVTASISFQGTYTNGSNNSSGDTYVFYIAKGNNGSATASPILETGTARQLGASLDIGALAVVGTVQLSPGDFIELWTENYFEDDAIFIASINAVIR